MTDHSFVKPTVPLPPHIPYVPVEIQRQVFENLIEHSDEWVVDDNDPFMVVHHSNSVGVMVLQPMEKAGKVLIFDPSNGRYMQYVDDRGEWASAVIELHQIKMNDFMTRIKMLLHKEDK